MAEYPEHEKMAAVKDQSQAIGKFLDWMATVGWHVAEWHCAGHYDSRQHHDIDDATEERDGDYWFHKAVPVRAGDGTENDCSHADLAYVGIGIERMLARHFDIDLKKISDEKDAMLAEIRQRPT